MQINRISSLNIQAQKRDLTPQKSNIASNTAQGGGLPLPTTAQYLAFTGGYSLDLGSTIKNLDKLAQKKSNVYPPQIREWAGIILEEGNKAKETLIDIHKKFYESLKDCFSMDEVKKKFPEFKEVISSKNVTSQEGSFIDDFHKGKLEYFDNDEDLSLQLIKLYWGEGFSINDLKQYSNGKDISYAMKKLHIHLTDPTYGKILKLSDPEYNARLTKEMAAKRLATLDRKAQEATGEPVYIKRGPMSAEHRQHISEGLLKYYQENPEALYNLSERQKEFYAENPERKKIMGRVATKAWHIFGADRIKDALSAYMKKNRIHTFTVSKLENPFEFTKEESAMMKKFWASNDWARKSFSKNMTYAWKKVKEEQTIVYEVQVAPKNFIREVIKFAKQKHGVELKESDFIGKIDPNDRTKNYINQGLNKYTREYVDSVPNGSNKMANSFLLTLLNINRAVSKMDLSKTDKETKDLCNNMRSIIKHSLFEYPDLPCDQNQYKKIEANVIRDIYSTLRDMCANTFNKKFLDLFETQLNKAYEYIDKNYTPGKQIYMNPEGIDL